MLLTMIVLMILRATALIPKIRIRSRSMNLDHGSRAIGTVDPWLVISAGFLQISFMLNHAGDP